MDIKKEVLSGTERTAVQLMGTQDKRTRPLGKAARPAAARLEDSGINAFGIMVRGAAARRARDLAKKASERAPHRVGGGSGREQDRAEGLKVKPEAEELQLHASSSITAALAGPGLRGPVLGIMFMHFDSYNFSARLKSGGLRV
jgi:hypothetical protein